MPWRSRALHLMTDDFAHRRLQRPREPLHDLVDLLLRDDERRRYHHEIAVHAVGVTDVRPDDEPRVLCGLGERLRELRGAREGGPRVLVFDELDPREQPAPAHVAHVGQLLERGESPLQHDAQLGAPLDQLALFDQPNRGEPRGAAPGDDPPPGAAMNAPTLPAPSRRIAASRAAPLLVGLAASSPRPSQRYGYGAGIRATSTSHSRNGSLYGSRADAERASRVLPWDDGARAMMRCLRGFPASIQYCRASFRPASTASEPPERKDSLSRPPGRGGASSRASSSTGPWVNAVADG